MIELRTPAQIEQMRPAGRFVADVLTALVDAADVGVNLLDLDALAHSMIKERGAESCYIDYHPSFGASPFGKVLCTSVNDAVLHGLPHDYVLRDGDLLSLDFACASTAGCPTPRSAWWWARPARRTWTSSTSPPARSTRASPRPGRQPARRHLRGDRRDRAGGGARRQPPVRRARRGPDHARRPARPQRRTPRSGPQAQARAGDRHRAVVPAHDRRDLHRPGRLDARGPPTGPGGRTWSTPSPSPRTARWC